MQLRNLLGLAAVLSVASAQNITGKLGDAKEVTTNPAGVKYVAWFNTTHAKGWVNVTSTPTGVAFVMDVDNLPDDAPLSR